MKNHHLHLVQSNEMEQLTDALAEEFFPQGARPFEYRLIAVPHVRLKDFLQRRLMTNPRLQIAAGVEILPLNQAILEILDRAAEGKHKKKVPSFLELSLSIEQLLHSSSWSAFPAIHQYIDDHDLEKKHKRIASLSDLLSRLFSKYGLYGQQFLPRWLEQEGWQQVIWRELFSTDSRWTYPLKMLEELESNRFEGKVALFGFSYLCPVHLAFFHSISASIYQLSPCALFWEDQTSDREKLSFNRAVRRKRIREDTRQSMECYLDDRHPLLGNWGKLRREMLKTLDAFSVIEDERYCELEETSTLLQAIKHSLLTLEEEDPLSLDDSLQLHSATSKFREIEILRDVLETLLQKHQATNDPISPNEILVLSPDISVYAPYIQMVFSHSPFAYTIQGIPLSSVSAAVQGFLQFISLPEEHFKLSAVIKLLRCSAFRQKSKLDFDEVRQLTRWFQQAQIRYGLAGHPNSWEEGLNRLLYGLAIKPNADCQMTPWPVGVIPQSEIDVFNRFLELFAAMKEDCAALHLERAPKEWFEFFLHLADRYFECDWEQEPFFLELQALAISCQNSLQHNCSFASIQRVLKTLAQKRAGEISSSQPWQKIHFASLDFGSSTSARIIYCLGMHEGAFPRRDAQHSLCEIRTADYCPSKTEEDRALFLDLLLQAKDYLIFSYLRIDEQDGKQQQPALLIEEFNNYLMKRGAEHGMLKLDHPAFAFDQLYFTSQLANQNTPCLEVRKWSPTDYLAAKAYYFSGDRRTPSFFTKPASLEPTPESEITIDLRQLKKLARHPIQFYFNETLNMYLAGEEDQDEQEFLISYLRKSDLRKKALRSDLSQVLKRSQAEGKLPVGLFQDVSCHELKEDLTELHQMLSQWGIRLDEISSLSLSASCREEEQTAQHRPPLYVPLGEAKMAMVTGTLEDITPYGLLYHGDLDLKSLVKVWPLYLIYLCVTKEPKPLLLTKSGKQFEPDIPYPQTALAAYLEYYLLAKQSPSPLMPEWAKSLLKGEQEEFKKAVQKESEDIYLGYLARRTNWWESDAHFNLWNHQLRIWFAPLATLN
jgi:exodeoxyribonuclease V gamma subunit